MVTIPDYKQLQSLKERYNNCDTLQLKMNYRTIVKRHKITFDQIAVLFNISINTTYSYTKKNEKNKPDLYNLLILSSYLKIDINEFFTNNSERGNQLEI